MLTNRTGDGFLIGVAVLDDSLDSDDALDVEADDDVEPEGEKSIFGVTYQLSRRAFFIVKSAYPEQNHHQHNPNTPPPETQTDTHNQCDPTISSKLLFAHFQLE